MLFTSGACTCIKCFLLLVQTIFSNKKAMHATLFLKNIYLLGDIMKTTSENSTGDKREEDRLKPKSIKNIESKQ